MESRESSQITQEHSYPPIDLIIPMVFPGDPHWQAEYARLSGVSSADAAANVRYRTWKTEELLVQCCIKYMPWLHCIHILLASESQVQPWMEQFKNQNSKFRIVYHRDFIPERLLPCFNVNTIEMWLHCIPDLTEHFIYSNDDLFPLSPLKESDFFQPAADNGQPSMLNHQWLPCQHHNERPYPDPPNIFHRFVKNGLDMVAADFGVKFTDKFLRGGHSMQPMLKSTVVKVCTMHADRISQSFTFRRSPKNFNQYIFPFWQHLSGHYIDQVPRRQYVGPKVPIEKLVAAIREPECGILCINDNEKIEDWQERAEAVRREISAKLAS